MVCKQNIVFYNINLIVGMLHRYARVFMRTLKYTTAYAEIFAACNFCGHCGRSISNDNLVRT